MRRETFQTPGPLALDLHLAVTYVAEQLNRKLDPRDPVGDYRSDGVVVNVGVTVRTRF